MRLIPKKTKLDSTIWKSLTFIDIILLFVLFLIGVGIFLSNLSGNWILLIFYVPLAALLFIPSDDGRLYTDIIHIVKYLFSHKHFKRTNKRKKKNVAALVSYKLDENGVLDYGSYKAAVISVGSVEFSLLSVYQQNERISAFASMFNMLATNETAQLVKIDRPINFDDISGKTYNKLVELEKTDDAAKKLIMRRRLLQLDSLNNVEKLYRPYYYVVLYSPTLTTLDVLVRNVRQALSVAELASEILSAKEVCTFLKYCNTRDFDEREIEDVPPDRYIDYITPNDVKFTSKNYTTDGKYAFTFAIRDYPLSVGNAWGADIFNIDNTKVVMTIKPVEQSKAIRRIDKTIVEIGSRSGGSSKASETIAQDTHLETMGALLQSLQNENEALFDCTLTVTGFNNTEMSNTAFRRALRQRILNAGFKTSLLHYRQFDGYVSACISARSELKHYARGINSESLAAVFPFVFTSIIEPNGMTLGESNGYPFIFDPFKWEYSNGEFVNANMFVAGTSGVGKSYLIKSLLSPLYSENSATYILDPENEYKHLCRNVGGSFIDVGSATKGRINPFHIYQTLGELEDENGNPLPPFPQATFAAHLQYLENFFAVTLPGISSDTLEEINNLIVKCYKLKGITQDTDCAGFAPDKFPVFDDLYRLVQSELKAENNGIRYGNLQRAETYLAKFATGGRFANLWNGPSTLEQTDKFTVFNFQSLFEAKNKVTSNGQMITVLRFLEQQIINLRELNDTKPHSERIHPIVVLDEGYMFIDAKNTCALDFVYQWYKRIRKYSGSMIFLTQNLADIVGNAEIISKTSAIINNTQYSFIMTLQGKDVEVLQDIFSARNLTEAEIEEIQRTNKPKGTAFFMGSSAQRAMLHVITDNVIETLFSRSVDVESMLEARADYKPLNVNTKQISNESTKENRN